MSFLDVVAALRKQLDVPVEMSLPAAVSHMSELMGLPASAPDGKAIPLPVQAEALAEVMNLGIPLQDAAAFDESDSGEEAEEQLESGVESTNETSSGSSSKKSLKQRKPAAPILDMSGNHN